MYTEHSRFDEETGELLTFAVCAAGTECIYPAEPVVDDEDPVF